MAEPSVSSTVSPYTDNSSEASQSSVEPQQPVVSEFPDGGPVLAEQPFGGPVEFNWPFLDSPFVAAIFPPSPRCLLRDLMAGSTMSDSGEEIPTSGEDY